MYAIAYCLVLYFLVQLATRPFDKNSPLLITLISCGGKEIKECLVKSQFQNAKATTYKAHYMCVCSVPHGMFGNLELQYTAVLKVYLNLPFLYQ